MDDTLYTLAKNYDLVDLYSPIKITDADYIMNNGKLIIGFEAGFPPICYYDKNGELIGFDVDFAKAMCQRLGIEAEFIPIDWSQKMVLIKERSIDCIWSGLSIVEEYREYVKYSRVYLSNKQVVVIKKSNASKYIDLRSLSGVKLSAEIGSVGENEVKNNKYLIKSNYISSASTDDVILALKNNEVDAIVVDYTIAADNIANDNPDFMILEELASDEQDNYGIAFRLGSDMTLKVNKEINNMIKDGTLESISKKYNLHELYESSIKTNEKSDLLYIISKGEMVVGVETDRPFMTYYDEYGELTGFDTEFAKAVGSKLGIDVVFKEIVWSEKEKELKSKNIDCIWNSLTVTEERRKIFSFSHVYLSNRPVVVIRKTDEFKYTDLESLSGAILSAGLSTTGEEALLSDPILSNAQYIVSPTQDDAVKGLKRGDFDAVVIDYTLAKGIIASNKELTVISKIKFQEETYAVGFRIDLDITSKINDLILDMILDGSLSNLAKKYDLSELFEPIKITDSNYIMNNNKIIIGFDRTLAPMSYYDNNDQLAGFDIDFAKAVCQRLGITAEFKEIYWEQKESELNKRNIDCIWCGLSVTEERRKHLKYSRVYMNNKQVVVIRKSNIFKYTTLESLSEAKLTSKIESLGEETIKTYMPKASYIGYTSIIEMFTQVQKGHVDALVIDYTIAKYTINNNGFSDLVIVEKN